MVRHVGLLALEDADDLEGRRLADVPDVPLVRDPEDEHARSPQALRPIVQGFADPRDHVVGHPAVDLGGELDEARLEPVQPGRPREVEGVDGNAVAAEARARVEGHEAERLGGGGLDDLPDVDVELRAHQRQLVHEADVHRPEGVLEELDRPPPTSWWTPRRPC
jgi:hypothetical protein